MNGELPLKVLILEDDPTTRHAIANILSAAPSDRKIMVDRAGSWAVGKQKMETVPPDLILLDLSLEDIDAERTLRLIPRLSRQAAVVVISCAEGADVVKTAIEYGAQDFIEKDALGTSRGLVFERMERAYQRFCAERSNRRSEILNLLGQIRQNIQLLK